MPTESSPSKSSLVPAVANAVEGSLVVRWAGAESEKLHMIWRYVRDSLGRSKTSRDFAMNVVKGCFDTGEAGDAEEPAASSEQLAAAKSKDALAAADLEQLQPAPVRRRCLTKKDSVVSVADSAPSPMRTPRAVRPRGFMTPAFVQLTPCDPRRVRFMTPARCMKTKKTKKTKKTEKTEKTSMKTKKTAMKCMKAKKTEKTSKKTSMKTSVPVIDLDEDGDERKDKLGFLDLINQPAKDFCNSDADRKWGEDMLKQYAKKLKLKKSDLYSSPREPENHVGCKVVKMHQRSSNIVQFQKPKGKVVGEITLGKYKGQTMFAANVLLYALGVGVSTAAWVSLKQSLEPSFHADSSFCLRLSCGNGRTHMHVSRPHAL